MITIVRNVTASLSDPERGPYFAPQPSQTVWSGHDPVEAARVYYEQSRSDRPAHPSGFSGVTHTALVPPALQAAFDAALAAQHEERDPKRIIARLPALPPGWDAVRGTQYDPRIIALRSPEYRETTYGDVIFLRPDDAAYAAAAAVATDVAVAV